MEIDAPKKEVLALAKFLDTDHNGFIDFKEFSTRFTATLPSLLSTKDLNNHNQKWGGSIVPSSNMTKQHDLQRREAAKTNRENEKALRPTENPILRKFTN